MIPPFLIQSRLDSITHLLKSPEKFEFIIASSTRDPEIPLPEGALHRPSSGQEAKITTIKLTPISTDAFLTSARTQELVLQALHAGNLGFKTADHRYEFQEAKQRELSAQSVKTIIINAQSEESIDQEAIFCTISTPLLAKLLALLSEISEGTSQKTARASTPTIANSPNIPAAAVTSKKVKSNATTPIMHTHKQSREKEIVNETLRAEEREKAKAAYKKDEKAAEKLKKHIAYERLKAEIKNSIALQNLIKNGEIDEIAFFKLLEKAEIEEIAFFKLLEKAEINEAQFAAFIRTLERCQSY